MKHKSYYFTTFLNNLIIVTYFIINLKLIIDGSCQGTKKKYTENEIELIQSINIQRIELLNKMCHNRKEQLFNIKSLSNDQMDHLLIDMKHKFLYCYVPKVACTNWKRVLMVMTNRSNETDPLKILGSIAHSPGMFLRFSDLSYDDKLTVLNTYVKFLIVRHPFERLLSAFRNKLEGTSESSKYFQARIGKQIIKYFRPNPSKESLIYGHDVQFSEFVQYLLTPEFSVNQTYNEHWEPISNLCNPCVINYNVIGKYETLLDDSALALYLANASNISFPSAQKTSGTYDLLEKYFLPFPNKITRNLYKLYEQDFKLFDYNLEDVFGLELV